MHLEVLQQSLTKRNWESLIENADLIEQDSFGPKVFDLRDGRMLKTFRAKRFWSSNLWSPFAKRFVQNTQRIKQLRIPSIKCLQHGNAPNLERTYVFYERLPGRTLR